MARNPAFGEWTEEETNWSDKDTEFIKEALKNLDKATPTTYEELVARNEAKLHTDKVTDTTK